MFERRTSDGGSFCGPGLDYIDYCVGSLSTGKVVIFLLDWGMVFFREV